MSLQLPCDIFFIFKSLAKQFVGTQERTTRMARDKILHHVQSAMREKTYSIIHILLSIISNDGAGMPLLSVHGGIPRAVGGRE